MSSHLRLHFFKFKINVGEKIIFENARPHVKIIFSVKTSWFWEFFFLLKHEAVVKIFHSKPCWLKSDRTFLKYLRPVSFSSQVSDKLHFCNKYKQTYSTRSHLLYSHTVPQRPFVRAIIHPYRTSFMVLIILVLLKIRIKVHSKTYRALLDEKENLPAIAGFYYMVEKISGATIGNYFIIKPIDLKITIKVQQWERH